VFDLIDYSFILASLAIFGFVIKDIFNSYRKNTTPYDIMKPSEKFFSYISTALITIALGWLILIMLFSFSYNSYPKEFYSLGFSLFNPFYEFFLSMVQTNIISEDEFVNLLKSCLAGFAYMTIFSLIYTFFYCIIGNIGLIYSFFETRSICVCFDNYVEKKYRRIIYESSDFFYLECIDNFRNWQAIPKSKVINIKNILSDSNIKVKFSLLKETYQKNPKRFGKFVVGILFYFTSIIPLKYSFDILAKGEMINFSLYLFSFVFLLTITIIIMKNVRDTS